ncbi:MAG: response regulator [Gammaproteobacteria bacterium]
MKKRILVVEDHRDTLEVLEYELEFLGYETLVATNGFEAVELAGSENPDLIIMDMMLPKLNGLEATFQIRSNPKTQFIPILAATAKAMPGDREVFLKAGCAGYIAKPFSHVELGQAIEKILCKIESHFLLYMRPYSEQPVARESVGAATRRSFVCMIRAHFRNRLHCLVGSKLRCL